jgi:hypothetical protein
VLFRNEKSPKLVINLNEVLSVRSQKVKLNGGLVNSVPDDEPNSEVPNRLYLYYAYKRNIYYWRVRKASIFFTTTSDKKAWESLLKNAISGLFLV